MIPLRIVLQGFLSYREEQTIDLEDADLWVFAGRNGSGKSSVFDAITFVLFGHHRGGARRYESLIHVQSDKLRVEFDFEARGQRYRLVRSLKRSGGSERQAYRFDPDRSEGNSWPAIPETNSDAGFKKWVARYVGLTYESFTSSVLLQQGRAESILDPQPKKRYEILEGVVGLERFRRLSETAESGRRAVDAEVRSLRNRVAELPTATEEQLNQAQQAVERSLERRQTLAAKLGELDVQCRQATLWNSLESARFVAVERLQESEVLLQHADQIEINGQRLEKLNRLLPKLREVVAFRTDRDNLIQNAKSLDNYRFSLEQQLKRICRVVNNLKIQQMCYHREIDESRSAAERISSDLAALAGPIVKAKLARHQRLEIEQLETELHLFPSDLSAKVEECSNSLDKCIECSTALPFLEQFVEHRDGLMSSSDQAKTLTKRLTLHRATIDELKESADSVEQDHRRALDETQQARDQLSRTEAIWIELGRRLEQFNGLRDSARCDRCGQILDPEHFRSEQSRLQSEVRVALEESEVATGNLRVAIAHEHEQENRLAECQLELEEAEQKAQVDQDALSEARINYELHQRSCASAFRLLPPVYQSEISPSDPVDWAVTEYPTREAIQRVREQVSQIKSLEAQLGSMRKTIKRLETVEARLEQARQSVAELSSTEDLRVLEEKEEGLQSKLAGFHQDIRVQSVQSTLIEKVQELANDEALKLERSCRDLERRASLDRARSEDRAESLRRLAGTLEKEWGDGVDGIDESALNQITQELSELKSRGVEATLQALPKARAEVAALRQRLEQIRNEQDQIPMRARRSPEEIEAIQRSLRLSLDEAENELREHEFECWSLQAALQDRKKLSERITNMEQSLRVSEVLCRLLGRDGIQRDLMRDAEVGILNRANPILQALSDGELTLQFAGGGESDPESALQLDAVERVGGSSKTIPVANLSGSQRFRVAVSLAIGIGSYARGHHGTIESVIIDEGFGSLDRYSRHDMIQQLNALRGHLAKIILVSHQEDFFEAFADGYMFERSHETDGSTVVRPFHR